MKKVIALVMSFVMVFSLAACSSTENTQDSSADHTSQEENSTLVVYEDEYVKVIFTGMTENESVPDTAIACFALENLSDQEITVYPMDSSVNDTMVMFLSGFPATMQAGKKFNQGWFFTFQNAGVSELSEITQLEFSLRIVDSEFTDLAKTDILTVSVS